MIPSYEKLLHVLMENLAGCFENWFLFCGFLLFIKNENKLIGINLCCKFDMKRIFMWYIEGLMMD